MSMHTFVFKNCRADSGLVSDHAKLPGVRLFSNLFLFILRLLGQSELFTKPQANESREIPRTKTAHNGRQSSPGYCADRDNLRMISLTSWTDRD